MLAIVCMTPSNRRSNGRRCLIRVRVNARRLRAAILFLSIMRLLVMVVVLGMGMGIWTVLSLTPLGLPHDVTRPPFNRKAKVWTRSSLVAGNRRRTSGDGDGIRGIGFARSLKTAVGSSCRNWRRGVVAFSVVMLLLLLGLVLPSIAVEVLKKLIGQVELPQAVVAPTRSVVGGREYGATRTHNTPRRGYIVLVCIGISANHESSSRILRTGSIRVAIVIGIRVLVSGGWSTSVPLVIRSSH